jgi:hypothetical protein
LHYHFEQHLAVELARERAGRDQMLLGLVLGVRGCAHGSALHHTCLRVQHAGSGNLPLDSHDLLPIEILVPTQLIAPLGQLGDIGFDSIRLAGARGP